MQLKWIIYLLACLRFLNAQMDIFSENPGFIYVKSDTSAVPIYINGNLIGHTPIYKPIPVLEGIHHISSHPPSIRDPFLQYANTEEMKQVFVMSGDTVEVLLDTYLLTNRLNQIKKGYYFTNYVGVGISLLVVWQLWILSSQ